MNFKHIMLIAGSFILFSALQAQTQAEIDAMLNGGNSTEEVKTKKVKPVKEAKAEKEAKTKKDKTKKEGKVKDAKPEKQTKEVDTPSELKKEATESIPMLVEEEEQSSSVDKPSSRDRTEEKPLRTWNLGIYGGIANPVTDIRYKDWFGAIDPINENQWSAGIKVTKMFDAAFGLQWRASYSVLQGAFDSLVIHQEDRRYLENAGINDGVYFRNNVLASSLNIYWNISNTVFGTNRYLKAKAAGGKIRPRKFSLIMFTGIGGAWFDPHVMFIRNDAPASFAGIDLKDSRTFEMHIPLGLGAKFNLGKSVDLGFEYVVNYVFTDKLDGFVFDHPDRIKNDLFTNLNVTLDFKLGSKNKTSKDHIEWVHPSSMIFEEIAKIDEMDRNLKKIMKDEDKDGVSDFFDKDTETKEGTVVDGSGRAIDSDGDGIPDKADLEPFSDKDAEVDEFGLSLDSDNDGVPNHKDLEPDSKKGSFVNFQGIGIDGKVKAAQTRGLNFPSIFFETDKATINRAYEEELFMVAKDMLRMDETKFLITGHCDERGSDEYNIELGKRRADAVKNHLVENYGIDATRIETLSKGKSEIDSPRFNVNRRADIFLLEK
jgi:OOP family OmpA-OmpF porin